MSHFRGRTAVLATMHGKEKVIAPLLEEKMGIRVVVPAGFDTDQFGTFTRDIPRNGNQLEAARRKALAAMKHMNVDLGIASEGSFGSDPHVPFLQSNLELVLLIDEKNKWEIKGHHRSPDTNMAGKYVSNPEEALAFARRVGFPEHGVVARKSHTSAAVLHKGITTEEELTRLVGKLCGGLFTKKVYIETDMRAHMNPTRMGKIAKATEDLIHNLASLCPGCNAPGFGVVDVKSGLMCSGCQRPTTSARAYVQVCHMCGVTKEVPREDKELEDPAMCNWCNP